MKDNIKEIARRITRMSSSDLSDLSSALMENGMSATIYRFSPVSSVWDEDRVCSIKLLSCTNRKLGVVKALKDNYHWGLKEAKRIADQAPTLITAQMTEAKAEVIQKRLEEAGAETEIVYYT